MDLNQFDPTEISSRRNHLFSAEYLHQNYALLNSKREKLAEKINVSREKIEKAQYDLNQNEWSKLYEQILEEQKKELKTLKQEMRDLDALLDEWDDLTESQLYQMREELFNEIWKHDPTQFTEQQLQWKELKMSIILEGEVKKVKKAVDQLQEILQIILQTRSSIKGRGLLRYIFSVSPNAIIERHLLYAHDFILSALQDLKHAIRVSDQTPLQPLFQRIYHEFDPLKDHCKSVWGFRHIDTIIFASEQQMAIASKELQEHEVKIQTKAVALKKKLDDWLQDII